MVKIRTAELVVPGETHDDAYDAIVADIKAMAAVAA